MGSGHQKYQAMIRSLKFLVPPPILKREERVGNGVKSPNHWTTREFLTAGFFNPLYHVHIVKAIIFPVVTYRHKSWTIKKAACQRIDAFRLWC